MEIWSIHVPVTINQYCNIIFLCLSVVKSLEFAGSWIEIRGSAFLEGPTQNQHRVAPQKSTTSTPWLQKMKWKHHNWTWDNMEHGWTWHMLFANEKSIIKICQELSNGDVIWCIVQLPIARDAVYPLIIKLGNWKSRFLARKIMDFYGPWLPGSHATDETGAAGLPILGTGA